MSALRSLLFLLFQIVVTPRLRGAGPAVVLDPAACRGTSSSSAGAGSTCWGALDLRHPLSGRSARENIPPTRPTPHIVMSKHSSTWETLALNLFFPPLAFVAKKELLSIPFFGWGFALASPITIDRKAGSDAMQQIAAQGRERLRAGILDRCLPGRNADQGRARARNTRPAARGSRSRSACRSSRSRTMRAIYGRRASSASGRAR